jgi:SulP family sulfate permease
MPDGSATSHLYRPKLATMLRDGYNFSHLRRDALAALTVAIVALPLSMAIAVASGVSPERGLYTAIVGGFLVSALGGSRFQIGGPAGAFIVLVAASATKFGIEGLLLTVLLSGAMLTLIGVLRLGSLIRHMPHAVIVGFTCGIAVTILASQLKDLGGLTLLSAEPGGFFPKLIVLARALPSLSFQTLAIGFGSAGLIFLIRNLRPSWPGMLIAVVLASITALVLRLQVATIGTRFGELPHGLPMPHLPAVSVQLILQILPTALSVHPVGGSGKSSIG